MTPRRINRRRKFLALFTALLSCISIPGVALAQNIPIDQQINELITPFTQMVAGIVFSSVRLFAYDVPILVIWLAIGVLFFTFYMNFINIRGFRQALRIVRGRYDNPNDPGEVTHFQALTAALSNTVGLGNIAGVAVAITLGGPGATFWMILAGIFGMSLKFTEVTLGHKYRQIDEDGVVSGGPMFYMSRGFAERGYPRLGKTLAVLASLGAIAGCFGSGAMFQTNQSTQQLMSVMEGLTGANIDNLQFILGFVIAALVGIVIIGGIKRIVHVTEVLVPFMAIFYLSCAIVIISWNIDMVPAAFGAIINGAFSPQGIAGGFVGVMVQGLRRATFSNEAGLGYAAIAHAPAKTKEPVAEGLVGLLEPFIDTVVVCTATALVIVLTGMHTGGNGLNGISLTSAAFGSVFNWFPYMLAIAATLFAFSTTVVSFYYSQRALVYLVGERAKRVDLAFKLAFLLFVVMGSTLNISAAVDFADATYMAIAFPNLIALYVMAPEVKSMLKSYMARVASGEIKPYVAPSAQPTTGETP